MSNGGDGRSNSRREGVRLADVVDRLEQHLVELVLLFCELLGVLPQETRTINSEGESVGRGGRPTGGSRDRKDSCECRGGSGYSGEASR